MLSEEAWLADLAARQPAVPPTTLGALWSAEQASAGLHLPSGLGEPRHDAFEDLQRRVAEAAGPGGVTRPPSNPMVGYGSEADRLSRIDALIAGLPEDKQKELAPYRDLDARAREEAAAIERDQAAAHEGAYAIGGGAVGNVVGFAAGMARSLASPEGVAGFALGGPEGGSLIAALGREFAVNAGFQAAQEPFVAAGRAKLGLKTDPLTDILSAGAFGAGAAGLFRGAAAVIRHVRGNRAGEAAGGGEASSPGTAAPRPETGFLEPLTRIASAEDLDALALHAERSAVMEAAIPEPRAAARIDEASAALETGRAADPRPAVAPDLSVPPTEIIRPNGARLTVRPQVVDLADLIVSHTQDGIPNPAYPAELQPRDRSSAASRTFIAERAKSLEPDLLGVSPTAQTGAPIVGPDNVVESGNGRVLMLARAYDRHPDRADAYKAALVRQGFDIEGKKFPVLVRVREGGVANGAKEFDRAAFAREANVSATAGLSVTERAGADAKSLDAGLLSLWRGGEANAASNIPFIRAFADRIVAAEERPDFVSADNRLSADGARRIEAALVARAWSAPDLVASLYEDASPTSRAILGALADTAPLAARLRSAMEEGRVPASSDVLAPILDAFRLVERTRAAGGRIGEALDQIDLERGAVPEAVRAAVRLFFRDDALKQHAGRDLVGSRLTDALGRAMRAEDGADLFGFVLTPEGNLKAAIDPGDLLELDATAGASEPARASGQTAEGDRPSSAAAPPRVANGGEKILQGEIVADSAPPPRFEMPATAEEAGRLADEAKQGDRALLVRLFGEEGAERYRRLELAANGRNTARADKAADDLAAMEEALTPEERDQLYGIGQARRPDVEELSALSEALAAVEGSEAGRIAELGRQITSLPDPSTPEVEWSERERIAMAVVRRGAELAAAAGEDSAALSGKVFAAAAGRFADPEDAAFMLQRFRRAATEQQAGTAGVANGEDLQIAAPKPGRSAAAEPQPSSSPGLTRGPIGDPAFAAAADDALAEFGDLPLFADSGSPQSAKAAIAEAEEDAAAAAELTACLGGAKLP